MASLVSSPLLIAVEEIKYMKLLKSVAGPSAAASITADTKLNILTIIKAAKKVTEDDVMNIQTLLNAEFEAEDALVLMKVCISKASTLDAGAKQENLFLDNYLTQSMWDALQSNIVDPTTKMLSLATLMKAGGKVAATEYTKSLANLLAANEQGRFNYDASLAELQRFKKVYAVAKPPASNLSGPSVYPEQPESLLDHCHELYHQLYEHEPPVASKWTSAYRNLVLKESPCMMPKGGLAGNISQVVHRGQALPFNSRPPVEGQSLQRAPSMESLPGFKWTIGGLHTTNRRQSHVGRLRRSH